MFYSYNHRNFLDWYQAANNLYKIDFYEQGGDKKSFKPLVAERSSHNHYLLFNDNEAGICGSAVFMPLPITLYKGREPEAIKAGTWILKDAHFFIEGSSPIQEDDFAFSRVIERFYLGLFKELWEISLTEKNPLALVFDPLAACEDESLHSDLTFFGGFKFSRKFIEQDEKGSVVLGVLSLNQETYQSYLKKKKEHEEIFGEIPSNA